MKACEKCGVEIFTKDGENKCDACEAGRKRRNARARKQRAGLADAMRSIGATKVRGNLGGTYWE